MNYKETLNLPRTDFPMKADLALRELEFLKFWEEIDLYKLIIEQNKLGKPFILHDGPPYANGDIHLGTTLNKVLKDFIVRYNILKGHFVPFVPGWDCHGQPIEYEVEKKLRIEKWKVNQEEFRKKCKEYALHFVERQKEQFKRLGIFGDWKKPYLTLDFEYEATNIEVFGELYQRGLIYKGRKPIYWCYHCETALAEAEIEYSEKLSPSIVIKFPLKDELFSGSSSYFLIWTTTPWTLPANVAIALHPEAKYQAIKVENQIFILGYNLVDKFFEKYEVVRDFKGKELEGLHCTHVLFEEKSSQVILADFVSLDEGTGCVHIAPGHGEEDYQIGLKYNLPSPMPVDNRGYFTEEAGKFKGNHIYKANDLIIDDLEKRELLVRSEQVTHSYPHCWRCKNPVIFRATEQWFISMDKEFNLRRKTLQAIKEVEWIPEWSINRITSMVEERPDWCISRQRSWGVPLPIFYCESCGKELITEKTIAVVAELFRKEGADSWFRKKADEILSFEISCTNCGGNKFTKETDIFDVWFESGISHAAVLEKRKELSWPADLYVEGSDQHRGWFQSSLLTSVGCKNAPPYRTVLTHGFVVDEEGRKMSKSLGNVIDPLEVIKKLGADILRIWVASSDFSSDVAVSNEILQRLVEVYRRIRNTARFIIGNLYDFDLKRDSVLYQEMEEIDKWALLKINRLIDKVDNYYRQYRFHLVFQSINFFCANDLSAFYFDVLKDRLYTTLPSSKERRSAQTALLEILVNLTKILSPILTFTCEEIWQHLPEEVKEGAKSVHLSKWPTVNSKYLDKVIEERWEKLLSIRSEVLKALERARDHGIIKDSLEASIILKAEGSQGELIQDYCALLPTIFIVSEVNLLAQDADFTEEENLNKIIYHSETLKGLVVMVARVKTNKCERCWNYRKSTGENPQYPSLCSECIRVIEKLDKVKGGS